MTDNRFKEHKNCEVLNVYRKIMANVKGLNEYLVEIIVNKEDTCFPDYINLKIDKNNIYQDSLIEIINGYKTITTFYQDFTIADHFGISAIKDTYKRAFNEWKGNYKYLTELVMVLNWKIWEYYEVNRQYAELYNDLWEKADTYACENLHGEEAQYFFRVTD